MSDFKQVLETKNAAQWRLFDIHGVHAVGIGAKVTDDQPTGELAIIVSVIRKKPLTSLALQERIPAEINGIRTDVVESEIARLEADPCPNANPDDSPYKELEGGIQIAFASGNHVEGGTIACIGRTDEPQPKIVALTCHHVVADFNQPQPSSLTATPAVGPPTTVSIGGTPTPGSLIRVSVTPESSADQSATIYNVFYVPGDTEGPSAIAITMASQVNVMAGPAVHADPDASGVITLTSGPGFDLKSFSSAAYGKHTFDPRASLQAAVTGLSPLQNPTITLTGVAQTDGFASVNVNPGGQSATLGLFVPIKHGDAAAAIAPSISAGINALHLPGLTASDANGKVTVTGAQEVECDIFADARVGHPGATFASSCSKCLDQGIGRVIAARIDLDAALVQLDPGTKYKAAIQEIGAVAGTYIIRPEDVFQNGSDGPLKNPPFSVIKRGRTTRKTTGTVTMLNKTGFTEQSGPPDHPGMSFYRFYTNAIEITSSTADPFSCEGDSGAALVTIMKDPADNIDKNYLVGVLFGQSQGKSLATPIDAIRNGLEFIVETSTDANEVRTVPATIGAAEAPAVASSATGIPASLAKVRTEITATPGGTRYHELLQRHFSELQLLVNNNRRVAAVWRRNGGPTIVQGVLRMVESHSQALPPEINGKPLPECLVGIRDVFARYGSPQLSADLQQYGPGLAQFAGLTYPQVLDVLRQMRAE